MDMSFIRETKVSTGVRSSCSVGGGGINCFTKRSIYKRKKEKLSTSKWGFVDKRCRQNRREWDGLV